jgi:histidinol dehydrogenase
MVIKIGLPERRPNDFSDVIPKVREIIRLVRENGDDALINLTEQLDGVRLSSVKVKNNELKELSDNLDENVKWAIDVIYDQLKQFNELLKPPNIGGNSNGMNYGVIWKPIEKVGIYVPSGKKSYPSTALMAITAAKVAGVSEMYLTTPPRKDGKIDNAIGYIASKLGVKEVYRVGGAQSIAALAYGTQTVKKVYKIVGPGNKYVQAAKILVSLDVGIDGIEGPTELVIILDESAKLDDVIEDIRAQAEHGTDTYIVIISLNNILIKELIEKLNNDDNIYYIVTVKDLDEALRIANDIAPEHLSLQIKFARNYLNKIDNAGAITLSNTPPALIDYGGGPNHILPTNGWAKVRGGLSVYDFLKPIMYLESLRPSNDLIKASIILAEYEGFYIHSKSIRNRYGEYFR